MGSMSIWRSSTYVWRGSASVNARLAGERILQIAPARADGPGDFE